MVGEERGIRRRFAIGLGDMEKILIWWKKSIVKFERVKKALPRDILPHAPTPVFFDIDLELSESPKVSFVIVLLSGTDGEIFIWRELILIRVPIGFFFTFSFFSLTVYGKEDIYSDFN